MTTDAPRAWTAPGIEPITEGEATSDQRAVAIRNGGGGISPT